MNIQDTPPTQIISANSKSLRSFSNNNKIANILLLLLIVVLPIIIGVGLYKYFGESDVNKKNTTDASTSSTAVEGEIPASNTSTNGGQNSTTNRTSPSNTGGTKTSPTTNSPGAPPAVAPSTPPVVAPSSIPQGVLLAIDSIEKSGLKNNSYVDTDTSDIPAGAKVRADRDSWTLVDGNVGEVTINIEVSGKTKKGSLFFEPIEGVWKVISINYSI